MKRYERKSNSSTTSDLYVPVCTATAHHRSHAKSVQNVIWKPLSALTDALNWKAEDRTSAPLMASFSENEWQGKVCCDMWDATKISRRREEKTIKLGLLGSNALEAGSGTGIWCCWADCFAGSQCWSPPRWPGSLWSVGEEPPWTRATGSCRLCFRHSWRRRPSDFQA